MTQRRHSSTAAGDQRWVCGDRGPLVRVLVEHQRGAGQERARRLVPRHEQGQKEHEEFLFRQRAAPTSLDTSNETRSSSGLGALAPDVLDDESRQLPQRRCRLAGGRSGDSMAASDQSRKFSRSASSIPRSSAITVRGTAPPVRRRNRSPLCLGCLEQRSTRSVGSTLPRPRAPGARTAGYEPAEVGMVGRVHVEDRRGRHRRTGGAHRIVDQCAPPGAEMLGIAARGHGCLRSGSSPRTPGRPVDRVLPPQTGQHLVIVRPGEEGRFPRVETRWRPFPARPRRRPHRRRLCPRPAAPPSVPGRVCAGHRPWCERTVQRDEVPVRTQWQRLVSISPYPASPEHAPLSGLDEFLIHIAPYPVR